MGIAGFLALRVPSYPPVSSVPPGQTGTLPGRRLSILSTRPHMMTGMAPPSKRRSPPQRHRSARLSSQSPDLSSRPFLRFYHSEGLRQKTLSVLTTLEQAQDARAHRDALADVVIELTNSGSDYFFMKPLRLAKVGFIMQQSANLGLAAAQQVMGPVIRSIIGLMDRSQLLSVSRSIRQLML